MIVDLKWSWLLATFLFVALSSCEKPETTDKEVDDSNRTHRFSVNHPTTWTEIPGSDKVFVAFASPEVTKGDSSGSSFSVSMPVKRPEGIELEEFVRRNIEHNLSLDKYISAKVTSEIAVGANISGIQVDNEVKENGDVMHERIVYFSWKEYIYMLVHRRGEEYKDKYTSEFSEFVRSFSFFNEL